MKRTSKNETELQAQLDQMQANHIQKRAWVTAAVTDLVEGKKAIDQLHADPYWWQLEGDDQKTLDTLQQAIKAKKTNLVQLIVDHNRQSLRDLYFEVRYEFANWLKQKGDKSAYELFLTLYSVPTFLEDSLAHGDIDAPLFYSQLKKSRVKLTEGRAKFWRDHGSKETPANEDQAVSMETVTNKDPIVPRGTPAGEKEGGIDATI